MCTAISYTQKNHLFGRTLDYETSFGEEIVITPRIFPLPFKRVSDIRSHYAIIGAAAVISNYPLYFDAVNEKGLSAAGLLFSDNAAYLSYAKDMKNIAPFEFIPWVLSQCATVCEAKNLLLNTNIIKLEFCESTPPSPLHWIISDENGAITVEPRSDGLHIYENPIGVLTNNPPFDLQLHKLSDFVALSPCDPENRFGEEIPFEIYSRGMGAIGLPGDFSSSSRFVRAAFIKENSASFETEFEEIIQFFHILRSVSLPKGCVLSKDGKEVYTQYSSCMTSRGKYFFTSYENSRINGVDLFCESLNCDRLIIYPFAKGHEINLLNNLKKTHPQPR